MSSGILVFPSPRFATPLLFLPPSISVTITSDLCLNSSRMGNSLPFFLVRSRFWLPLASPHWPQSAFWGQQRTRLHSMLLDNTSEAGRQWPGSKLYLCNPKRPSKYIHGPLLPHPCLLSLGAVQVVMSLTYIPANQSVYQGLYHTHSFT